MRTRSHEIETESRRIVVNLLPSDSFVERDQTERDYGIDMAVECFRDGNPMGTTLLLQLKGTDGPPPCAEDRTIPFDMAVQSLIRAERFVSPILLIWCPVRSAAPQFWYLWIQDYIRVVLNYDNPNWRQQKTVRLHLPADNIVRSGGSQFVARWRFIADHPKRLDQFGQLARISHEARVSFHDHLKVEALLSEALALDAIFSSGWSWAEPLKESIDNGLLACRLIIRGTEPTIGELRVIGWKGPVGEELFGDPLFIAENMCEQAVSWMSAMTATYFNYGIKYGVWVVGKGHAF